MKFTLKNKLSHNTEYVMRKAGYTYIFDNISQQGSFVRKLTSEYYPRFHLYITETKQEITFDLHLDQAKTRYKKQKAHRADYKSDNVKVELTKLYHIIKQFIVLI